MIYAFNTYLVHISEPVRMRRCDHQRAGTFGQALDDYEEELRAFSRKREWEREKEKHKKRICVSPSSSDDESKGPGSQLRTKRKRLKKHKAKNKGTSLYDSEGNMLEYVF